MKQSHEDQREGAFLGAPPADTLGDAPGHAPGDALFAASLALRAMVEELRAAPTPELRWEVVERRLFDRIARGEGGPSIARGEGKGGLALRRGGAAPFRQLTAMAAAAAAVALLVNLGAQSGAESAASAPPPRLVDAEQLALAEGAAGQRGDRDLAALRVGHAVEARAEPVSFARAGVLRFTLAPKSRVVVVASSDTGVGTIVSLERGAIRAEVEPRDPSEGLVEAFAVDAGTTRVAVHGTAFTVARVDGGILVDIEHGTVAVGPVARMGVTMGYSLVGPARASFSLDGARSAARLLRDKDFLDLYLDWDSSSALGAFAPGAAEAKGPSAPAPSVPAVVESAAPVPAPALVLAPAHGVVEAPAPPPSIGRDDRAEPLPAASALAAEPPAAPAPSGVAEGVPASPAADSPAVPAAPEIRWLTAEGVKGSFERCVREAQSTRPSQVRVSIVSTLSVAVRADGSVASAVFNPPLSAHHQACASVLFGGRFKEGPRTVTIPLRINP